ncbi:cysteine--tRNA ligase [Bosea sp. BIWAKO-01]|uniref:cysteine--tRNA ligase n=1 Tax=Bosea sp. BIWAKO-01 TaxID=506668 RepID=UPI0008537947|nr:cysteine--tRNA ligase [Bosea sp. BIWAKO-01]GAU80599.1 cysteinyl-tRNA synthetase [Bosea sp. BIWAKO-01]
MTPTLRLYNTLTRTKETFAPIDPGNVRMYVCGPTVYDYAHIGNARPVIVFDVLYRLLRHLYGAEHVTYARNLTDVDDKINARAARDFPGLPLNEAIARVTQTTTAQFHNDVDALGNLRPDAEPRATDHIEEMKAIIERLIARGIAYVAEEHVLFHVPAVASLGKAPKYGSLARRSLDEMMAGARVDVAPYKRDAMDFVLWKPSRDGIDPGWPSPAGIATPGRPGWHIECSAMSMAKLLAPFGGGLACDDPARNVFDIHGGGIDLVFPHHENEIAQSCCAFGGADGAGRMANIWMHNGFLQVEGEKMSKSLGNFVTINELLQTDAFGGRTWPGEVLRLAMLKTHYRQPIDWTVKSLEEVESIIGGWEEVLRGIPTDPQAAPRDVDAEIVAALADDLNTAKMMTRLHGLAREAKAGEPKAARALAASVDFLGLNRQAWGRKEQEFLIRTATDDGFATRVDDLIQRRLAARRAKDFAESDRIRDELAAMGIQLKDGKDPATGEPTTAWEVKR